MNAAADGHTLLLATNMNAINATVYDRLNYNFIRDVAPVASIVDAAFVMEVNPSVPAKTVPEFIAYAKGNPGKLNFASSGTGSPEHVAAELFMMTTGVNMLHVPYRGSAPALIDLVGGQVQVYFGPIAPSIEHIKAGKLRALAVTTAKRSQALPDIPAVGELCRASMPVRGKVLAHPGTRRQGDRQAQRSGKRRSPMPICRHDLPTSASQYLRARPATSESSSPRIPRGGPRSSGRPISGGIRRFPWGRGSIMAAVGASASIVTASARATPVSKPPLIDVHHHFVTRGSIESRDRIAGIPCGINGNRK